MCSLCKMDNKDSALRLERQGAVDSDDFYKETNYKPKRAKSKKNTRPGCPGNNRGKHLYTWTTETQRINLFYDYFGFHREESMVCVGCGKIGKSRKTKEYRDKFPTEKKFFSPEFQHKGFMDFRKEFLRRHGYIGSMLN